MRHVGKYCRISHDICVVSRKADEIFVVGRIADETCVVTGK
jgi:hypothetical protein